MRGARRLSFRAAFALLATRVIVVTLGALALGGIACDPWSVLPTRPDPLYCDTSASCTDGARPRCDTATHSCVAASPAADLGVPPDLAIECTASSTCPDARPVCDSGHCRPCAGAADDAACAMHGTLARRCGPAGTCVVCTAMSVATDCAAATPVCDAGACRACKAHAECATSVCLPDGTCELQSHIAVVDSGGLSTSDCLRMRGNAIDGSPAHPYCDVQSAIDTSQAPTVLLRGGPYDAISVGRSVLLVGPDPFDGFLPGQSTLRSATKGVPAVQFKIDGLTVTLDGLRIGGATSAAAVDCEPNNSAHLVVRGAVLLAGSGAGASALVVGPNCTATVSGSQLVGGTSALHVAGGIATVSTTSATGAAVGVLCEDRFAVENFAGQLTLDASSVSANSTAGVECTGTGACTLTNDFVWGNGNAGTGLGGVVLGPSVAVKFVFNTVARNLSTSGLPAGVQCQTSTSVPLVNSIIWGNTQNAGSQLSTNCALTQVVTGAGDLKGMARDPAFVNAAAGDFHLKKDDPANMGLSGCCVDLAPLSGSDPGQPWAAHDHDLGKRPLGKTYDIGAHEVQ